MRSRFAALLLIMAGGLTIGPGITQAQHATEGDIADGERAFASNCASCHGPDGNLIAGIDFGRGLFRREYTDAELVGIILNGIPNTPMPATARMSAEQAEQIVGYLRSLAERDDDSPVVGDRTRGRELFFGNGACTDCHAVNGRGARHGPDLTAIGTLRRATEIEAALRDPSAAVQPTNRRFEVWLGNGERVAGRLLNHDTFTVQMIDDQERLRSFIKAELRNAGFVESSMPDYGDRMTAQQIADLVSYLTSLRGARDE